MEGVYSLLVCHVISMYVVHVQMYADECTCT